VGGQSGIRCRRPGGSEARTRVMPIRTRLHCGVGARPIKRRGSWPFRWLAPLENPKPATRNPNEAQSPKPEIGVGSSSLGFLFWSFIRISGFGFRVLPTLGPPNASRHGKLVIAAHVIADILIQQHDTPLHHSGRRTIGFTGIAR